MSFGGSPTGEGINLPVKWHRGDSVRACAAAEGVSRALKASDSCRPQPHHQSAGLPFTGWSGGRVSCSAGNVSGASQAPRASTAGRLATCVTHGSPDAARCEDAPESKATGTPR